MITRNEARSSGRWDSLIETSCGLCRCCVFNCVQILMTLSFTCCSFMRLVRLLGTNLILSCSTLNYELLWLVKSGSCRSCSNSNTFIKLLLLLCICQDQSSSSLSYSYSSSTCGRLDGFEPPHNKRVGHKRWIAPFEVEDFEDDGAASRSGALSDSIWREMTVLYALLASISGLNKRDTGKAKDREKNKAFAIYFLRCSTGSQSNRNNLDLIAQWTLLLPTSCCRSNITNTESAAGNGRNLSFSPATGEKTFAQIVWDHARLKSCETSLITEERPQPSQVVVVGVFRSVL